MAVFGGNAACRNGGADCSTDGGLYPARRRRYRLCLRLHGGADRRVEFANFGRGYSCRGWRIVDAARLFRARRYA